jgi:predicted lipoprotein with Yx(FWY)xxD motif/predicted heme/steroid binding protein
MFKEKFKLFAVLFLLAGGPFVLSACGYAQPAQQSANEQAANSQTPATAPPSQTGTAVKPSVKIAETKDFGKIFVDGNGMTLYTFTKDATNTSVCYGQCETNWPPLYAEGKPQFGNNLNPEKFGVTTRTDGKNQITFEGMPLYYFIGDKNPGDTNGQNVNNVWFVYKVADDDFLSTIVKTFTLEEIAKHSTETDCWMAIHGKVYNVTGFDANHPGKKAVYQGCGKDATQLFETRPMGSGTPHSEKARSLMPNFEIGTLAQN